MYKIIIDSCGELFPEMLDDERFINVPLTIEVGGEELLDDESFDQADLLRRIKASPTGPKSACPPPAKYLEAIEGEAEHVYIVTLSSEMSGSYNSALVAKSMYEEKNDDKQIYVFDSKSASVGQTLIGQKAAECEENGMGFKQVVEAVEKYIAEMHTFFVLETLETLRKNGRLSKFKERIANTLHIKPVMAATDTGNIMKLAQVRGMGKALSKMADCMMEMTKNYGEKVLAISHCNCLDRALELKKEVEKRANFKKILVISMRGISTLYANEGGLIMCV